MHDALQKEIATYEKRTPKSAAAHKRALQRIPLGVASNYRHYEPYPIFVKDGKAGRIHDVDGNEYVDHNLCFGALMAGHCHPAVVKAVEQKLHEGTTFGMPHEQEWELAEERSEEHTSELQSQSNLVCRLLLEKKKKDQRSWSPAEARVTPEWSRCGGT